MLLRTTMDHINASEADLLVCPVDTLGAAAHSRSWGSARMLREQYPNVFAQYAARCERGDS